jgi:hypothetical protein
MEMNPFILIFISLPEAFLNIFIILLFAGEKCRLKLSKPNIIRFLSALSLMLLASCIIRPLVPNFIFNAFFHVLAYTLIIKTVYKINFGTTILSVLLLALFFATVENSYYPLVITYVSDGLNKFFEDNFVMLICTLPTRVIQVSAIVFLWKHYVVFAIAKLNKSNYRLFVAAIIIITTVQLYFSYNFVYYFSMMLFIHRILYSTAIFILAIVFNVLIFKLIYSTGKGLLKHGIKRCNAIEQDAELAFIDIYNLLKKQDINGAIEILEELLDKNELEENKKEPEVR